MDVSVIPLPLLALLPKCVTNVKAIASPKESGPQISLYSNGFLHSGQGFLRILCLPSCEVESPPQGWKPT